MDEKDYLDKLYAFLWRKWKANGYLMDWETDKKIKGDEKIEQYIQALQYQVVSEGVHPNLPYFENVMQAYQTPALAQAAEDDAEFVKWQKGIKERETAVLEARERRAGQEWQAEFGLGQRQLEQREKGAQAERSWRAQEAAWEHQIRREEQEQRARLEAQQVWAGKLQDIGGASRQNVQYQQEQQRLAEDFERFRQQLLTEYSGYSDWVRAEDIRNRPNIYQQQLQGATSAGTQLETLKADFQQLGTMYPDLISSGAFTRKEMDKMMGGIQEEITAQETQIAQSSPSWGVRRPATPIAPRTTGWMAEIVPSWQAGQPIPKEATARVASPQLYAKTTPTQREMLGGYLESPYHKGIKTLRDYEAVIAQRLPKPSKKTKTRPAWQI